MTSSMVPDPKGPPTPHAGTLISFTSGPLPQPDILARYEQICPGSAAQIIENALEESRARRRLQVDSQQHRQTMATRESEASTLDQKYTARAQALAAIINILLFAAAVIFAFLHSLALAMIAASTLLVERAASGIVRVRLAKQSRALPPGNGA